jgi:hypothetical protein
VVAGAVPGLQSLSQVMRPGQCENREAQGVEAAVACTFVMAVRKKNEALLRIKKKPNYLKLNYNVLPEWKHQALPCVLPLVLSWGQHWETWISNEICRARPSIHKIQKYLFFEKKTRKDGSQKWTMSCKAMALISQHSNKGGETQFIFWRYHIFKASEMNNIKWRLQENKEGKGVCLCFSSITFEAFISFRQVLQGRYGTKLLSNEKALQIRHCMYFAMPHTIASYAN